MTNTDTASIARRYIESVGAHDLETVRILLDDELLARFAGGELTKEEWLDALARLLPALTRNDISEVFTAGDRVCIVYDFVTDTPAGAVQCAELLTVRDGRIVKLDLLLDRVSFAPVNAVLQERAAAA